ncbi:hypothetical protein [Kutzneria sp. NPDC051319]
MTRGSAVEAGTAAAFDDRVAPVVDGVRPAVDPGRRTGWTTTRWR